MQVKFSLFETASEKDVILNCSKIAIILFVAIYLLENFSPFYEAKDGYLYGIVGVNLSEGVFSISNELLDETGKSQFIGTNWLKTIYGDAIPRSGLGFSSLAAVSFIIGGYYGLFYLSPLITILLFIFSERISTKLFGKYCGLLTLLFLSTNHLIFRNGVGLQTESIFSLFFIVGCYFLVTFFHKRHLYQLFLTSIFFVAATFMRINGIILFPAEIILLIGFFIIVKVIGSNSAGTDNNHSAGNSKLFFSVFNKKSLKLCFLMLIPWIIFLIFLFSYNNYYFGEPFTNYRQITATANEFAYNPESHRDAKISSLFSLETKNFENVKGFSKYLLPYQFPATYLQLDNNFDNIFGNNWLGLVGILILFLGLIISLYSKNKRLEILIFLILISSTVWFFSAVTTEERAAAGYQGRYMIAPFILSSMILSFLIIKFLKLKIIKHSSIKISVKVIKVVFVIILISFFSVSIYHTNPAQSLIKGEWEFKNPQKFADRYPLDLEGLTPKSVILAENGDLAVDYGVIPFYPTYRGEIHPESIELLKQIILDRYDVLIFKQPTRSMEKDIIKKLINDHDFIVKDYSKSFCKIMLKELNDIKANSDDICLNQIFKRR